MDALAYVPWVRLVPMLVWVLATGCGDGSKPGATGGGGAATFTRDVAPILVKQCAYCHRPGQSAPFSLLSYEDARKRSRQIMEVTQRHYMPPWLPSGGQVEFVAERRLTSEQIRTLQAWHEQGAPEGDPKRMPALPVWSEDWQMGKPDLVATMPESFTLAAEGEDVYRNFVVPISNSTRRYVRAIEFDPGNRRIVHHAFFMLDQSGSARRQDEEEPGLGFSGIHTPVGVLSPEGHFLSWQPGKQPSPCPPGMPWTLEPRTDLVLQLHLQPSGKPETIQAKLAFYFDSKPPVKKPLKIWLSSYNLDIPEGQERHLVQDQYTLPADVDLYGILPHAHYLAREMEVYATLPNGTRQWLIQIPQWNFNWQGDYRYVRPIPLPKGTRISMNYLYDNSTNNPANPFNPPQRVRYGIRATDEMAELWLQVLPRDETGRDLISTDYQNIALRDSEAYHTFLLRSNPNDARAMAELGKSFLYQSRFPEAGSVLRRAIAIQPQLDSAHYYLGLLHRFQDRHADALYEFTQTVQINPDHAKAHGNLGIVNLEMGQLDQAETHLRKALALNPEDDVAQQALQEVLKEKREKR